MFELEDAHEHLGDLIKVMQKDGLIDDEDYAIQVAHVHAHLNRAWNSRELKGAMTESERDIYRAFPDDLAPLA